MAADNFRLAKQDAPATSGLAVSLSAASSEPTVIVGTSGDDILLSTSGDDWIDGRSGFDIVSYVNATGPVEIHLSTSAAQNTGGGGVDMIGNVEGVIGSDYDDVLYGSLRGDWFEGGAGNDWMDGNFGRNTASYASAAAGVTVNLNLTGAQNTVGAGIDTLINISQLVGSSHDDHLVAKLAWDSELIGGKGDDLLEGNNRDDDLYGDDGDDTLFGRARSDLLVGGNGNDLLDGGDGNDMLLGGAGNDSLDGGAGFDTADYRDATAKLTIDLRLSAPQNTRGSGVETIKNIEQIYGSNYADTFYGTDADEILQGGNGGDTIYGNDGNDILRGIQHKTSGNGYSSITGFGYLDDGRNDNLYGGNGDDQLNGGLGDDLLDGGDGFDTVTYESVDDGILLDLGIAGPQDTVGAGVDTLLSIEAITGSLGNDVIHGADSDNLIDGYYGSDTLYGEGGNDTLFGGRGYSDRDWLYGGDGNDILNNQYSIGMLFGEAGDDILYGNDDSMMNGGDGNDTIYASTGGYSSGAILNGDAGDDHLSATGSYVLATTPTAQQVTLNGGDGKDVLYGGVYASVLNGGADDDILDGGNFPDTLSGGDGDDILDGGNHTDTVTYADATAGVTVSLAITVAQDTGGAGIDTLLNVERLVGSAYGDVLSGGSGDDRLFGGYGADTLSGDAGYDVLDGGAHTDTASYADTGAAVRVDLTILKTQDTGGAGMDRLVSIENLLGSAYDDRLSGDAGNNRLTGGVGADWLNGREGNDILSGGAQDDHLTGGLGNDRLTGGDGQDIFFFNAPLGSGNIDTIVDFAAGEDMILLEDGIFQGVPAGILAASHFVVGTAALDADDHILYNSVTGALLFDADGTGATQAIQFATLTGLPALTNGDFLVA